MGDKTKIEWTDATWNPIRGCSRVSEGCRNCYAESVANRFKGPGLPYEGLIAKGGQWNGQIKLVPEKLDEPIRWTRPRRIFVNSMSDLFHENVPDEFIEQVFAVMALAPQHTFQVLTKRPKRMLNWFMKIALVSASDELKAAANGKWPLPNVWLGVSVEDQATADERIPLLLQTPAAVRWISAEPLLGPINLEYNGYLPHKFNKEPHMPQCEPCQRLPKDHHGFIDWVVVGGESGKDARPMDREWVRDLRDQCARADVPFLFKQWGEWAPNWLMDDLYFDEIPGSMWMDRQGKKVAGRILDGRTHDEYPKKLSV